MPCREEQSFTQLGSVECSMGSGLHGVWPAMHRVWSASLARLPEGLLGCQRRMPAATRAARATTQANLLVNFPRGRPEAATGAGLGPLQLAATLTPDAGAIPAPLPQPTIKHTRGLSAFRGETSQQLTKEAFQQCSPSSCARTATTWGSVACSTNVSYSTMRLLLPKPSTSTDPHQGTSDLACSASSTRTRSGRMAGHGSLQGAMLQH